MPRVAFTQPVDAKLYTFSRAMQSNCFLEKVRTCGIKAAVASKKDAEKSLVEVDHADQELGNHFSIVLSGCP